MIWKSNKKKRLQRKLGALLAIHNIRRCRSVNDNVDKLVSNKIFYNDTRCTTKSFQG